MGVEFWVLREVWVEDWVIGVFMGIGSDGGKEGGNFE